MDFRNPSEALSDACRRARGESPFLRLLLEREPDIAIAAEQGALPSSLAARIDDPAMPVARRLSACPGCGTPLDRPVLTCPECALPLDDSAGSRMEAR